MSVHRNVANGIRSTDVNGHLAGTVRTADANLHPRLVLYCRVIHSRSTAPLRLGVEFPPPITAEGTTVRKPSFSGCAPSSFSAAHDHSSGCGS